MPQYTKRIHLDSLADGKMPGLSTAMGASLAEAAAVCLHHRFHVPGRTMFIDGDREREISLDWTNPTRQQRRTYADLQFATEFGAYGIAISVIRQSTRKIVLERSAKGTGVDFWLGRTGATLFQRSARLEVSGILQGTEEQIAARVARKMEQINIPGRKKLPAYIAVVEFGSPRARIVKK